MSTNLKSESESKESRSPIVNPQIFIPRQKCALMKEKYNGSTGWKIFADLYKNSMIKMELAVKQKRICPVCGEFLSDDDIQHGSSVHHLDYDVECKCKAEDLLRLPYERPSRTSVVKTANCLLCKFSSPESFDRCINALMLCHRECHENIHSDVTDE